MFGSLVQCIISFFVLRSTFYATMVRAVMFPLQREDWRILTEYANGSAWYIRFCTHSIAGFIGWWDASLLLLFIWQCVIYGFIDLSLGFNVFDDSILWLRLNLLQVFIFLNSSSSFKRLKHIFLGIQFKR